MKLAALGLLLAAAALPAAGATESFTNVPLVDVNCSAKVAAKPGEHPRSCAIQCSASGYGVIRDGKFLKFDAAGNDKALAALKASDKKDHLRADVAGDVEGDTIKVTSLKLL